MFRGTARLTMNMALTRAVMRARLAATVTKTGEDIAEATKANMYPGHFYDTGESHDTTAWEQIDELSGRVHVPTPYAEFPEFGTRHMAPRPALTPAVAQEWPEAAFRHWREENR